MNQYHKIQTVFKRDPATKYKTLLEGEYSIPEFKYLANNEWYFTEKVDGRNTRVIVSPDGIIFAGKTDKAEMPSFLLDSLNTIFPPLEKRFAKMFQETTTCLYFESYGYKIQSGGNYDKDNVRHILLDIKFGNWWLKREDIEDIALQLNLEVVPIIGFGTLKDMVKMAQKGFYSQWGKFIAEGIVAKPTLELKTRSGERIITKIKHKDFKNE